jgi:hypothetical protein
MLIQWTDEFHPITLYDSERIEKFAFKQSTQRFLIEVGLPRDAAPFLSFVKNNDVQYEGILRLTDYFDFLEATYSKYVVIGSNGNGDEIVIDTRDDCRIKLLDHEDSFSEQLINSSIHQLCSSLIIYQYFIDCIIEENGKDAFIDSIFNDDQLNDLTQGLTGNDLQAMGKNCFWFREIGILIANREEMRK